MNEYQNANTFSCIGCSFSITSYPCSYCGFDVEDYKKPTPRLIEHDFEDLKERFILWEKYREYVKEREDE